MLFSTAILMTSLNDIFSEEFSHYNSSSIWLSTESTCFYELLSTGPHHLELSSKQIHQHPQCAKLTFASWLQRGPGHPLWSMIAVLGNGHRDSDKPFKSASMCACRWPFVVTIDVVIHSVCKLYLVCIIQIGVFWCCHCCYPFVPCSLQDICGPGLYPFCSSWSEFR